MSTLNPKTLQKNFGDLVAFDLLKESMWYKGDSRGSKNDPDRVGIEVRIFYRYTLIFKAPIKTPAAILGNTQGPEQHRGGKSHLKGSNENVKRNVGTGDSQRTATQRLVDCVNTADAQHTFVHARDMERRILTTREGDCERA